MGKLIQMYRSENTYHAVCGDFHAVSLHRPPRFDRWDTAKTFTQYIYPWTWTQHEPQLTEEQSRETYTLIWETEVSDDYEMEICEL